MKTDKQRIQNKKRKLSKKTDTGKNYKGNFFIKKKEVILLACIIVITVIIYFPALHHKFTNWDDDIYITNNKYIKALTPANIEHLFTKPVALNYHPLTMLSFALNYKISGPDPFSYFLVNLIFHIFNIILTYYLAYLLLDRNKISALFVAAIFAVHPMHVESVAWISERKDVLFTFFFLSSMLAWISYISKKHWKWYLFSFILFAFAGFSKPSAVVLPLVLLLIDYFYKRKFKLFLFAEKIPFLIISIGIGLATIYAQKNAAVADIRSYNLVQQCLFASYGFFIYIFKLFVPFGLSALHPAPVFKNSFDLPWIYFVSPVFSGLIIAVVIYTRKFSRIVLFGLLFYFLNIMLTLQFIQVGTAVIAERYTYISYTGLLLGIVWLINYTSKRKKIPMSWMYSLMILYFGILSILASRRVSIWKNSEVLWTDVITQYPGSYIAYNNRGSFYLAENLPRLAISDYTKTLSIDSNYVKAISGRGHAYFALDILDSALHDFNRAYRIDSSLAISLGNRGAVFFKLGQFQNAIDECNRVIANYPDNTDAYLNRGVSYSSLQQWDLAIKDYTYVINGHSENASVFLWRGVAYRKKGLLKDAISDFTQGIAKAPSNPEMYTNRSIAYELAGMHLNAAEDVKTARKLGANVTEESLFSALK